MDASLYLQLEEAATYAEHSCSPGPGISRTRPGSVKNYSYDPDTSVTISSGREADRKYSGTDTRRKYSSSLSQPELERSSSHHDLAVSKPRERDGSSTLWDTETQQPATADTTRWRKSSVYGESPECSISR